MKKIYLFIITMLAFSLVYTPASAQGCCPKKCVRTCKCGCQHKPPVKEKDTDGDGLVDSKDDCPNEAGPAAHYGCPDSDGDGLVDARDRCPQVPGPADNGGCPVEVVELQRLVYFNSDRFDLSDADKAALNDVVGFMKTNPSAAADINGYTDNSGLDEKNIVLSKNRADIVLNYLKNKGIAANRLRATGHGSANPVATNDTAEGRTKNRRTEIVVK